jgi:hypothetical protein
MKDNPLLEKVNHVDDPSVASSQVASETPKPKRKYELITQLPTSTPQALLTAAGDASGDFDGL